MNAIIFGATGMVGQGVLRECLLDPEILHVLSIVRSPTGQQHPKLRELMPWLRKRFPQYVTTTEQLGRAMIAVSKYGAPKSVLESADINKL